jgi:hypothetical protein
MWQPLYQAFNNFWTPTPELRAVAALPVRERIKQLRRWSYWRACFRWPVIWRRSVVVFVAIQLYNVGYLAVRGFQTVALERQEQAGAALALESAAQRARTAKAGSPQYLQARLNMREALNRLAVSTNTPKVKFLGDLTKVQVNQFDKFDVDGGLGELCKHLGLSLHDHADAATQRTRLNVHALYCVLSDEEVGLMQFDDLPNEAQSPSR